MTLANSTIGLIRSFFAQSRGIPQPETMSTLIWKSMYPQYGGLAAGGVAPLSEGNSLVQNALNINTDLLTRYADYGDMSSYPECVSGDSLVWTLNGVIPIKELCDKYKEGETFKVFCYDVENHLFTVSDAHSPRKAKTAKVIKIYFDNGTMLRCTPDHPILRRDCQWIHADKLNIGDSVMVLETRMNKSGYMRLCHPENPENFRWQNIHIVVRNAKWGIENSKYIDHDVHHMNGNKLDNSWDNLNLLPGGEHWNQHLIDRVAAMRDVPWTQGRYKANIDLVKQRMEKEKDFSKYEKKREYKPRKHKNLTMEQMIEAIESSYSLEEAARKLSVESSAIFYRLHRYKIDWRQHLGNKIVNHKVIKIEDGEIEDVYDLSVEKHHNFIANGIVVHNCFTSLNIWADEATQEHVIEKRGVWFDTDNEQIKNILDFTFHRQLRIEDHIWQIARNIAKYGNAFKEIVVQDGVGVVKLIGHKSMFMRRIQDDSGNLFGFIEDPTMSFKINTEEFLKRLYYGSEHITERGADNVNKDQCKIFEPWEVCHFRHQGDDGDDLYGISNLEAARWAWKRLQQMEDALVIGKLTRAPQRFVYYVDVGDVPPNEARKILNTVKQEFKKNKLVDPISGKLNFKHNVLSQDEDIFIARRKDKRSTEIEVLSGLDAQSIADTEYFRNKLVSSLGIPKSYLGYDETVSRANLNQMDVRCARSVLRLQKCLKMGLRQIADVDLSARNIDPNSVQFDICMTVPSGALEIAHIEVAKAKAELCQMYQGLNIPDNYLWSNILGMTDGEIEMMEMMRSAAPQPAGEIGAEMPSGGSADNSELPPENPEVVGKETQAAEKPKAAGGLEASKYRRIPRDKQIMDSRHVEVLDRILSSNTDATRRINELKYLVNDIRSALPRRR